MADVTVESEIETGESWEFEVMLADPDASRQKRITLTLSWADYDLWSGGSERPADVAVRLIDFWLAQGRSEFDLPDRFNAATIRRWFPDADDHLRVSR